MARLSASRENEQVRAAHSDDDAESHNAGIAIGTDKQRTPGRLDRYLQSLRRTRAGRLTLKIVITALGAAVVGIGLILVPLPGPGWLIVFAGIAIWSLEFHWARRLNGYVRSRVSAWTTWYGEQGWPLRIVVGFATVVLVVAVIAGATYMSFGSAPFRWLGLG
jgi:uncharacterized protein (TIGR02611 family)